MKITKDINKFTIEVVNAIALITVNDAPKSLYIKISKIPITGIKSKDDNNMIIIKKGDDKAELLMIIYHLCKHVLKYIKPINYSVKLDNLIIQRAYKMSGDFIL